MQAFFFKKSSAHTFARYFQYFQDSIFCLSLKIPGYNLVFPSPMCPVMKEFHCGTNEDLSVSAETTKMEHIEDNERATSVELTGEYPVKTGGIRE